jgi:hypothetical protein
MTTKNSPLHVLEQQADKIALILKKAERGESVQPGLAYRVTAARNSGTPLKVGVVMDDKTIILDIPLETIAKSSEKELSVFVLKTMQETRDDH